MTIIVEPNYVRGEQGGNWTAFTGTIIFESIAYTGSAVRLVNQPAVKWVIQMRRCICKPQNADSVSISGANGGNVFPIGALSGGDSSSLIGGGTQGNSSSGGAANTIWAVGGLGLSTTNGSQILDGGCGLRVVGGSLTLTNNTLSFGGKCLSSAMACWPLLRLGTNSAGSPINYTTNTTYLVGTNITIVDPGVLDMSQVGDNTLHLGHNGTQTLFGDGTIKGNLIATNNLIAPAWGASSRGTFPGNLRITGSVAINFGSTLQLAVSPTVYDTLLRVGRLTLNSLRLTVITTGSAFANSSSNVFRFFQRTCHCQPHRRHWHHRHHKHHSPSSGEFVLGDQPDSGRQHGSGEHECQHA